MAAPALATKLPKIEWVTIANGVWSCSIEYDAHLQDAIFSQALAEPRNAAIWRSVGAKLLHHGAEGQIQAAPG